jgi:hypothetical protein
MKGTYRTGWTVAVVLVSGLLLGSASTETVAAEVMVDGQAAGVPAGAMAGSTIRPGRRDGSLARASISAPVLTSVRVPWRTVSLTIRDLTPAERFELRDRNLTTAWPPTAVHDRYGVPMRIINGYRRYHPVGLAGLGLKYLSSYRRTKDQLFLDRAERMAAGLERIKVVARGAIWFPYRFTFTMHGNPTWVNRPPWYSGMAQGYALAFFVRLWEQTRDPRYRTLADETYDSLRSLGRRSNPWVSRVDGGGYLWIEEYPQQLDRTLNGYMFALFGVYDYFVMTKDRGLYSADRHESTGALLRGGITTIKTFAGTFRNRDGVSDYCLAHHYRNPKYHPVHIRQFRQLERITGDPWFGRMADLYAQDVR